MVEIGHFGKDTVCLAAANIYFYVEEKELGFGMDAVFWSLRDCPYKVVVIPVTVVRSKSSVNETTHANMLIIDKMKTRWEIERFEPHGQLQSLSKYNEGDWLYEMQEHIDVALKKWCDRMLPALNQPFTYRRPMDVCPRPGPQTRSEAMEELGGFCQTWVLLYIDARLSNPDLTAEEILEIFFELPSKELYEMIQDYVHFVRDTKVPPEFINYVEAKKLMVIVYSKDMDNIRESNVYTEAEVREISHEYYKLIASAPVDETTTSVIPKIGILLTELIMRDHSGWSKAQPIWTALRGKLLIPEVTTRVINYVVTPTPENLQIILDSVNSATK